MRRNSLCVVHCQLNTLICRISRCPCVPYVLVVVLRFQTCIRPFSAGFLSTGDSNAPGNYALLDQVAALHWIKENIEAFGGDPHEVTLLGQGYGGAMVNLLLISPVTKGLEGLHAFIITVIFYLHWLHNCSAQHFRHFKL